MLELMAEYLTPFNWFLAISPILLVLFLMIFCGWSGSKAGAAAWFLGLIVASIFFGGTLESLASGTAKGFWETIFIFLIIWGAMAIYGVLDGLNAFPVITEIFNKITKNDRLLQILIIGMVFPAWMQGVLGFGTPVAVAAPLLLGLGFDPVLSVVIPALGHSWTITFGSLGSSYWVLQRFTGLAEQPLAYWSGLFFIPMTIMVFFFGIFWYSKRIYGSPWRELRRGWFAWLSLGVIQSVVMWAFASWVYPSVAGFVAGFVGLLWGVLLPHTPFYNVEVQTEEVATPQVSDTIEKKKLPHLTFNQAFLPYYVVIAVVFVIYLSPLFHNLFGWPNLRALMETDMWVWGLSWPQITTDIGFIAEATEKYSPLKVLTMPGTLIFASLFIAVLIYKARGLYHPRATRNVINKLMTAALPATLTLITLSMMSVLLMEHGMTTLLALGAAEWTGGYYTFISNFVGQLGAFMTGSNTASNVVFSTFQRDTALVLGANPYIMAALQTVGGAIGNIHCPMNVALGTATVGIVGREGEVIAQTLVAGLIMGAIIGIIGLILMSMFPV